MCHIYYVYISSFHSADGGVYANILQVLTQTEDRDMATTELLEVVLRWAYTGQQVKNIALCLLILNNQVFQEYNNNSAMERIWLQSPTLKIERDIMECYK